MFGKQFGGGKQKKEGAVAASFCKKKVAERGEKLRKMSVNGSRKGHVSQARQRITVAHGCMHSLAASETCVAMWPCDLLCPD